MSQLDPYLFFDGNCAEAMRFYEKTLGGKMELLMKLSEAPPGAGAGARRTRVPMRSCTPASTSRASA